ncbi:hypothetical protein ACWXWE_07150 [Pantoea ananatis]
MSRTVEIRSVREGVYLLWCMGDYDGARHYAFSGKGDISNINTKIDLLISQDEKENNRDNNNKNSFKKNSQKSPQQTVLMLLNDYAGTAVNESHLEWAKGDEHACLFLWLSLYKDFTRDDDIASDILDRKERMPLRRERRDEKYYNTEMLNRPDLPVSTPDNTTQCYLASIYLLDLILISMEDKNKEMAYIRDDYLRMKEGINTTFSWLSDADTEMLAFTWKQIKEHRRLLSGFGNARFHPAIQKYAIPVLFELWNAGRDEKELFLSRLRKRYANTKHRKKVADKAPINIRISQSAKKTLVKIEKRLNRNRADVIEYLIEKTWAELNQKN